MPKIFLTTKINAPIDRVFDLARSIDMHKATTYGTREEAIAGRTTGLIELNETVTFRATHFGIRQTLTSQIIQMEKPFQFTDSMLKGVFKSLHHVHTFKEEKDRTLMTDDFDYTSPLGPLGKFADWLFLKNYLTKFLIKKNNGLKEIAESEEWKMILTPKG